MPNKLIFLDVKLQMVENLSVDTKEQGTQKPPGELLHLFFSSSYFLQWG